MTAGEGRGCRERGVPGLGSALQPRWVGVSWAPPSRPTPVSGDLGSERASLSSLLLRDPNPSRPGSSV